MKLSIIIPIYNVEKYLRVCLDSCLKQDVPKSSYEIITVNDGSPDSCDKIIEEYYTKFPNIRVITQKNSGLSVARNNGLNIARGEYVWFVDSDDYITTNCLGHIYKMLNQNPDILQLNYQKIFEDGQKPKTEELNYHPDKIVSGKEVMLNGGLPAPAPFSIYKLYFIKSNDLKFVPGIFHEDTEFKPRATYLAQTILYHSPIVYNYLQRSNGSITSKFKIKNAIDLLYVNDSLIHFYKNVVTENNIRKKFREIIGLNINSVLDGIQNLKTRDCKIIINHLSNTKYLFFEMIRSGKIKYQLEGFILFIMPSWGIKLRKLIKK